MRSENNLWMPGTKRTKNLVYTVDIKLDTNPVFSKRFTIKILC